MKTLAPELSALMIILRSTGPGDFDATILRCPRGTGAQVQSASRIARVSGRKSGSSPASNCACRDARRASSSVTAAAESALQARGEGDRIRRQDLRVVGRDVAR